jgi:V8-like Glu-specific endopeptidase
LNPHAPRRLLVAVSLLVAVAAPSCGRDQPQFTLARRPIINGQVDTTHQSVVALVYTSYGTTEQFCTGTVIAPRWVLTAAHCYRESGLPPNQTKVFFGQTVGAGGTTIAVVNAYTHPQYYLASNGLPVNDVCVVELGQDSPAPAMPWQSTPLGNVIGQSMTFVGYGVTDAASQTGNGTRRAVDEVINDQDSTYIIYGGGTSGTCQGDSGGPAFTNTSPETVIGVTSAGDQSCVQQGYNTRVDTYADFIKQYVGNTQPQPVTVGITQPQNGSTQGSNFGVSVTASSAAGVARVDLYLDGALQSSLNSAPYTFTLNNVAAGAHTIRAVGTGTDGGTGEASVSVTVAAAPCSTQAPCATGFQCVNGQCIALTPGSPGASCTLNTECVSGMCIDGASDGYCTEPCGSDQDCHNQAACLDVGGTSCTLNADCVSGVCAGGSCAGLCGPPYSATAAGGGPGREVVGGCRGAPADPATPLAGALLLLLCVVARRRPRR